MSELDNFAFLIEYKFLDNLTIIVTDVSRDIKQTGI